jgi:hypothetical protein
MANQLSKRRLTLIARTLWISGPIVALIGFAYEMIVVQAYAFGVGDPDAAGLPIVPGIVIFSVGMAMLLAGLVVQRCVVPQPEWGQRLLWASAWLGWAGALLGGIGRTSAYFSPVTMTQGGFILAMMMLAGIVVLLIGVIVLSAGIARVSGAFPRS